MSSYLDLRSQIAEQLAEHQILVKDISSESAQVAQFKTASGSQAELRQALQADAATVAAQAGISPVTGPGLQIVIRDNPKLPFVAEYAGQFGKESDQIVSQIVNDLFANGATAISINGQRLVTTSSIRLVQGLGQYLGTLQVNTYPIAIPYVITAQGDINHMMAVLTVNNVKTSLNLMQEDCLIHAKPGPHGVRVPGYTGPLPGTWAKEVGHS